MRDERAALLARADALGQLGDQQGEVASFGAIASEAPVAVPVRLRLGHALRALGRVDEAIAEYRAILAEDPRMRRGLVEPRQFKSARFDDADLAAMRAALADPELAEMRPDPHPASRSAAPRKWPAISAESFTLYAAANALRHKPLQA